MMAPRRLAFLIYMGSPQSKDGDERLEEKIDFLMGKTEDGERVRRALDEKYPKK